MKIKIKLEPGAKMPVKKTSGAACFDCYAQIGAPLTILPHQTVVVSLGIHTEFDSGYFLEVRGRSGLASSGLWVNTGTVDSDYRGTIGAIVLNTSKTPFTIQPNDRIAQILLHKIEDAELVECEELSQTERGNGGFGHTGK